MSKNILISVVIVGIAAIILYNFRGTNVNTEGYHKKILKDRVEKDKEFKESDDSPLTNDQKEIFSSLSYFPINEKYKVSGEFHRNSSQQVIKMAITDGSQREYHVFGNVHFHLDGKELDLTVYKPVKSDEDYLFIPFYDQTCGDISYGGGRYVEPILHESNRLEIDFNQAYNPYCVYNHQYRCPIPPQVNNLDVSILAGEKIPDFSQ